MMQVSVEATGNGERRVKVQVPDAGIEKEVNRRLAELSKTVRIKGFRPGKIPLKVVKQNFGVQVQQEMIDALIQKSLYPALTENNIYPIDSPIITQIHEEAGSLTYVAEVKVMPEVTLAPLAGVTVDRDEAEVTDADLQEMLERLRKQRSSWESKEGAAAEGDRVTIDYLGTLNGAEFSGNRGQGVMVTLGSNRMIAGFEAGLIGTTAGSEVTLNLRFPEDYPQTALAGQPVDFAVTVQQVELPVLPEIDEAFAKKFGIEDGSLESLQREIRNNMALELKHRIRNNLKKRVLDKLLELNRFEVPAVLVERESQSLMQQMQEKIRQPNGKSFNLSPSDYTQEATRRIQLGLIVATIIREQGLTVDPTRLDERLTEIAQSYESPQEVIEWYRSDKKQLAGVESVVLEDQVIDWVVSQMTVNSLPSSFQALVDQSV